MQVNWKASLAKLLGSKHTDYVAVVRAGTEKAKLRTRRHNRHRAKANLPHIYGSQS